MYIDTFENGTVLGLWHLHTTVYIQIFYNKIRQILASRSTKTALLIIIMRLPTAARSLKSKSLVTLTVHHGERLQRYRPTCRALPQAYCPLCHHLCQVQTNKQTRKIYSRNLGKRSLFKPLFALHNPVLGKMKRKKPKVRQKGHVT